MKERVQMFCISRLAHLIWGLDTPPRLTMLRVGTQWSEEQTSGRTALSDHLYHVISSHKHFWWARVGQSRPELASVGWREVSGKTQGSGFRIRAAYHILRANDDSAIAKDAVNPVIYLQYLLTYMWVTYK